MALFSRQGHERQEGAEESGGRGEVYPERAEGASADGRGRAGAEGEAFLGKGSRVEGKISFEGLARIEGQVEGEITGGGAVVIGETAVVNAAIKGASVVIKGSVTGDISARERVEVLAPGKLYGNITTPSLVIEEGVVFEGHCSMGGGESGRSKERVRGVAGKEGAAEHVSLGMHSNVVK